eukprot:gnl/TRDRNA2_/TRDRNA2_192270_c0_seq1.p1 gnl/TRDRNA2_/TRDRNA2_192270_c0~~gnl/TRDRNA2_/TRDRNA2_192270_c0_seq1.p1  ORF type:complete len:569 (-),score=63.73 gnl/TRDRNA2_/TRDRNA2_192270_c0_seq1:54-1760(-)
MDRTRLTTLIVIFKLALGASDLETHCGSGFDEQSLVQLRLNVGAGRGKLIANASLTNDHRNRRRANFSITDIVNQGWARQRAPEGSRPTKIPSIDNTNTDIHKILAVVAGMTLLGFGVDKMCPKWPLAGRIPAWSLAMLLASYLLIIPGCMKELWSVETWVNEMGSMVAVTFSDHDYLPGPKTESLLSFLSWLCLPEAGSSKPAAFVLGFYALGIPGIKLLLLLVGECWRGSKDPYRCRAASWCTRFVQSISKWACPDMFVYVLMCLLFNRLDKAPLVTSGATMLSGFSCYCIFCLLSTISSLAIYPHDSISDEKTSEAQTAAAISPRAQQQKALIALIVTLASCSAFFYCMLRGMNEDALTLDVSLETVPTLTEEMILLARMGGVEKFMSDRLSFRDGIEQLWNWYARTQELTCGLALVLFAVFVVLLTVLDVLCLAALACLHAVRTRYGPGLADLLGQHCETVSCYLGHLAMLDVCVFGIALLALTGETAFKSQGLYVFMKRGVAYLAIAESFHYLAHYVVMTFCLAKPEEAMCQDMDKLSRIPETYSDSACASTTMPCSAVNTSR